MAKDRFLLRLPADLKGELEDEAKNAGQSLNAHIVERLQQRGAPADVTAITGQGIRMTVRGGTIRTDARPLSKADQASGSYDR